MKATRSQGCGEKVTHLAVEYAIVRVDAGGHYLYFRLVYMGCEIGRLPGQDEDDEFLCRGEKVAHLAVGCPIVQR